MRKLLLTVGAFLLLLPNQSQAHIKWFCAYDTTVPPLPISSVLTRTFAAVAILFCSLMFVAYVIDRAVNATDWAKRLDNSIFRSESCTNAIMRAAVGILFLVLWDSGGTILTPELKTTSTVVPLVQLVIAASMLSRSTLKCGAVGIMALYVYAVEEYGAFHMMDYPIFPGVALYLALTGIKSPSLCRLRLPVLYTGVAVTMIWGAIEKFGYPYWTFPLLATHQNLTLGFSFEQFMYIAGFVELSLAFFMITGTTLLRWSCAALMILMLSAIPEFGRIDAVGHLLIVAGLLAMIIAGQRTIQMPLVLVRSGIVAQAATLTMAYTTMIAMFFGLYYGSQFLAGR
jgi:hypothetical protein